MSLEGNDFVRIKVEPGKGELEGAQAMYKDHETEKPDPQTSHLDEIKLEPNWTTEESKFEESVAQAGLYVDHIVKEEIVLGPEVIGQPKVALPYPGSEGNHIIEYSSEVPYGKTRENFYKSSCKPMKWVGEKVVVCNKNDNITDLPSLDGPPEGKLTPVDITCKDHEGCSLFFIYQCKGKLPFLQALF
ncbi:uncharacterized protein LOC133531505 isoform X2 [Cydia pomonella]|uniref:uncharacterized protein LOC133531505 isoform X2 n=1 Tax=Cydia pomonella TaxID=82600 RepID=UPI002ADDC5D6|nr:uncharacterized protein LOC133531505 isoform X2 [Cydia pomonella]